MCTYSGAPGVSYHDLLTAGTSTHKPEEKAICGANPSAACKQRFHTLDELFKQAEKQLKNAVTDGQKAVNSIIFNVFIFCQVSYP